jgi:lipopolysaccharide/colanic/teichoic acid biosynthesis glycosyltransferase
MLKRSFDVLCALAALLVLSPVLLGLALAIKMSSPGPVFYRGVRVGLHGRPFRIFKFRSMVINADQIGGASTADGDPRITAIGRALRKTKLDELPQLMNVLAGDMSLVGPRPEVQQYVDMYTEAEKAILTVRPGLTDWASLWNTDEGAVLAGAADPERAYLELIRPQKLKWQLAYVRERSFLVDLSILARTFWTVVSRRTPSALMDTSAPPLPGVKRG